jgi:hypothetical protein
LGEDFPEEAIRRQTCDASRQGRSSGRNIASFDDAISGFFFSTSRAK